MKLVVDASVVSEFLLQSPKGKRFQAWLEAPSVELSAPYLIDMEVLSFVRRYTARDDVRLQRGRWMLSLLKDFPIVRYPHVPLLDRGWTLRHNISAYDAAYVALAEILGGPLLTCDARLAAAPGHTARIELI